MKRYLLACCMTLYIVQSNAESFDNYILPKGFSVFSEQGKTLELPINVDGDIVGRAYLFSPYDGFYILERYETKNSEMKFEFFEDISNEFKKGINCVDGECNLNEHEYIKVSISDELKITNEVDESSSLSGKVSYISDSSVQSITSVSSYEFIDVRDNDTKFTSLDLNSKLSFSEAYIDVGSYTYVSQGEAKQELRKLSVVQDTKGNRVEFGFTEVPLSMPTYQSPDGYIGIGVNTNGRSKTGITYISKDVNYTASYAGRVNVYDGDKILGTYKVSPGLNKIDTSEWPEGNYRITIEGSEDFNSITYEEDFYKLRMSDGPGLSYFFGLEERNTDTTLTHNDKSGDTSPIYGFEVVDYLGGGIINNFSSIISLDGKIHAKYGVNYSSDSGYWYIDNYYLNSSNSDNEYGFMTGMNQSYDELSIGLMYEQRYSDDDYKNLSLYTSYYLKSGATLSYDYSTDVTDRQSHSVSWKTYNSDLWNSNVNISSSYTDYKNQRYDDELTISLGVEIPIKLLENSSDTNISFTHNNESGTSVNASSGHSIMDDKIDLEYGTSAYSESSRIELGGSYHGNYTDGSINLEYAYKENDSELTTVSRTTGNIIYDGNDLHFVGTDTPSDAYVLINSEEDIISDVKWELSGIRRDISKPIGVSGFSAYSSNLYQDKNSDSLVNIQGGDASITLYPGDVMTLEVKANRVKELISVAKDLNGKPIVGAKVISNEGISYTDSVGQFSILVSRETKSIKFSLSQGVVCNAVLDQNKFDANEYVVVESDVICK